MDNVTLKKKLSTYVSDGGYLRNVSDEVLYELLTAWEEWTGTSAEFYRSIGFSRRKMAGLIGKAKKLKREGHFGSESFKEVKMAQVDDPLSSGSCSGNIELIWEGGKIIRFPAVDHLLEFVKKAG